MGVLSQEFGEIKDALFDDRGWLWVITGGYLRVFDGRVWTARQGPPGVYTLEAMAFDPAGRLWLGHYGGVSVLDGGQWKTYNAGGFGLGQNAGLVSDVAVDRQGRVWAATASGVAVFNGDSWAHYDDTSGLNDAYTKSIVVDRDGRVWVAHSDGVDVFDGSGWVSHGRKNKKTPFIENERLSMVQALAVDGQGNVWAGTYADGVSVFNGTAWQTYDSRQCFYGGSVNAIGCDGRGRIWLGTDFGLAVFDGTGWSQYTKNSSPLLSNNVSAVVVTGAGPSALPRAPALEPGSIRGTIKSGGQPVAGATVVVCWQTSMLYSGDSPCSGESYSAVTDERGEFRIFGVPPYRYDLAIKKPDGKWKILLGNVYVIDGEMTDIGVLSL